MISTKTEATSFRYAKDTNLKAIHNRYGKDSQ